MWDIDSTSNASSIFVFVFDAGITGVSGYQVTAVEFVVLLLFAVSVFVLASTA